MLTPGSPAHRSEFFGSLESLRGIAALSVAMFHVHWSNPVTGLAFFQNSYLMVDLFFVLSGFVICHSYQQKIRTPTEAAAFLSLRLGRLYPVHLLFLGVALCIQILRFLAETYWHLKPNESTIPGAAVGVFFKHLLLLHGLSLDRTLSFNGPSWSISVEYFAYVFFAVTLLVAPARRNLGAAAGLLLGTSIVALLLARPASLHYNDCSLNLARCTTGFFLGVLTYRAWSRMQTQSPLVRSEWVDGVAIAALFVFMSVKSRGQSDFTAPPIFAGVILLLALNPQSRVNQVLNTSPFRWLGKVSYSVYMAHTAVIYGVAQILRVGLAVPFNPEVPSELLPSTPVGLAALLAALVLLLLGSWLSFHFVEDPSRRYFKSYLSRWAAGARAAQPPLTRGTA